MFLHILAMMSVLTMACAFAVPAEALDKAEQACAAAKLKATGKKENAKLKCEAIALIKDLAATNADCLAKAEGKFAIAFEKAEAKGGCVSDLDAVLVEASVDEFVGHEIDRQRMQLPVLSPCEVLDQPCGTCGDGMCALTDDGQLCVTTTGSFMPCPEPGCPEGYACIRLDIWNPFPIPIPELSMCLPACSTIDPPVLDKAGRLCAASKLKATGKNAHSKLKCEAKGILKDLATADPECLDKADTKLGIAFGKAEDKGGCASTGDLAAVGAAADGFVATEVSRQKEGFGLPTCNVPSSPCGTCGDGTCLSANEGMFCISPGAGVVSPCPTEGCPAGSACVTSGGNSGCVTGCP